VPVPPGRVSASFNVCNVGPSCCHDRNGTVQNERSSEVIEVHSVSASGEAWRVVLPPQPWYSQTAQRVSVAPDNSARPGKHGIPRRSSDWV
jgi:hypothetical protein